VAGWYDFAGVWLTLLVFPVVIGGIFTLYIFTLNRLFLFFLPSSMFIALLLSFGAMACLTYLGLSIHLLGLHLDIARVLPPTCDAATVVFGPGNLPCQVRELRDWAIEGPLFGSEVPVKLMARYGLPLLLVVVVGLGMMRWCVLIPRCKDCGLRLERVAPKQVRSKNLQCYRCWDPELALKGAHVDEKGGLVLWRQWYIMGRKLSAGRSLNACTAQRGVRVWTPSVHSDPGLEIANAP